MMHKLIISIIFSYACLISAYSQNIFDLKGKSIIIPKTEEFKAYEKDYSAGVYTDEVLDEYKFEEDFIYHPNILGERIDVQDVIRINSGKKKEAILVIAKHNESRIVLYFPKQYKQTDKELLAERFYKTKESSIWVNKTTACLDSIFVYHYDAAFLDSINCKYLNQKIYYVGKESCLAYTKYGLQKIQYQFPYKFKGVSFEEERRLHSVLGFLKVPCIKLELGNKEYRITIKMDSNDEEFESYDLTFQEFLEYFEPEEEFINNSKKQYDLQIINNLKLKFEGKEIYLKPNNHYIHKGYYLFKEIAPSYSNDDGIYYKYFAQLEDMSSHDIYEYPITNDLEEYVIFAEEQRKVEEEEARIQAQKEAEFQAMLEKEEREHKASLIRKYGKKNALLILDNKVQIGFTKQMCIEAWGEPYDINRTITSWGVHEQWVYGIDSYLYFEDNILTAIQD